MNGKNKFNGNIRLFLLRFSVLYGGILCFLLTVLYFFLAAFLSGTVKYLLIQIIILPLGILSITVFAYLSLDYYNKSSEDVACSLITGAIISILCLAPGLYMTYAGISALNFELSAFILFFTFLGLLGIVFGILSLYIALTGKKTNPQGLEQWKINGLRISIVIFMTGLLIAWFSMSSGVFAYSKISYEITINTSQDTTFFLPLPVNESRGDISEVMYELKIIDGTADWRFAETIHGKALEIHTNKNCTLAAKKTYTDKNWDEADEWLANHKLSMFIGINKEDRRNYYEFWVFSSNENSTANIRFNMDDGWDNELSYNSIGYTPNGIFTYSVPLDQGWEILKFSHGIASYD